jgi:hypothetical protein
MYGCGAQGLCHEVAKGVGCYHPMDGEVQPRDEIKLGVRLGRDGGFCRLLAAGATSGPTPGAFEDNVLFDLRRSPPQRKAGRLLRLRGFDGSSFADLQSARRGEHRHKLRPSTKRRSRIPRPCDRSCSGPRVRGRVPLSEIRSTYRLGAVEASVDETRRSAPSSNSKAHRTTSTRPRGAWRRPLPDYIRATYRRASRKWMRPPEGLAAGGHAAPPWTAGTRQDT